MPFWALDDKGGAGAAPNATASSLSGPRFGVTPAVLSTAGSLLVLARFGSPS